MSTTLESGKSSSERRGPMLLTAALVVVALWLSQHVWKLWIERSHSEESRDWKSVNGTISGGTTSTVYRNKPFRVEKRVTSIEYYYHVDEHYFTGHRVNFSRWPETRDREEFLAQYSPGMRVKVLYRPQEPSRCTLQAGGWDGDLQLTCELFVIAWILGGLFWIHRSKNHGRG